jgi:hypothetical protein
MKHFMQFFSPDDGGGDGGAAAPPAESTPPVEGGGSLLEGASGSGEGAVTPPAPPNGTTVTPGWVKSDGSWEDGVFDRLPENLQSAKATLEKYPGFPDLVKAHMGLRQKLGKGADAVYVPGENASPEEVANYRKALGVPDSADAYQLKPEALPEGMTWSDELSKPYAEIAHKHNIPPSAMKELVAENIRQQGLHGETIGKMVEEKRAENLGKLKEAWGNSFDKNLDLAKRGAAIAGIDPNSEGFSDPNVVMAVSRLASNLSEDKLVRGEASPTTTGRALAKEILTNSSHPLHQKYVDGDQDTVDYVRRLHGKT